MHRRHRRGFIIVFGQKTRHLADGQPPLTTTCPGCREETQMHGKYAQVWFTLFFMPVFPMESRDKCTHFSQCGRCKGAFVATLEQLARQSKTASGNDHSSAIRLYNELRDHPADAERMLKLLNIYDAMNDLREAESSARAFPAAFANDPRCADVLDRIRARSAAVPAAAVATM